MSGHEHVDRNQIRSGPIRNESLSPELLSQIKTVFDLIGEQLDMTLEQFEICFMRDSDPVVEVSLRSCIAAAWLVYHDNFVGDETLTDEEEKRLLSALLAISAGVEDPAKLNVRTEVGQRLLQCYDNLRAY